MKLRTLGLAVWALAVSTAFVVWVSGCGSPPSSLGDTTGSLEAGSAATVSCGTPNTGCDCSDEGVLIQCGEVTANNSDGTHSCSMGNRRCQNGKWSACSALVDLTPSPTSGQSNSQALTLTPSTACVNNPCDPYCQQITDSPDGGLHDDAAVGTSFDAGTDGPSAQILATLADGGKSFDGGIYHVLTPGTTAIDPINVSTTLNTVDVYFMFNSTVSMQSSFTQLASQIPSVVSSLQTTIPNIAFGDGRFTNYEAWPYGSQQSGNVVYENRTSISTNATLTENDIATMKTNASTLFVNTPYVVAQSATPALYSMATNNALQGWVDFTFPGTMPSDWWWNVNTYYGDASGASLLTPFFKPATTCTTGVGAPCFRPNAYHIVMLFEDAPLQNGAAGSFPYYQFKPQYFPWNASADYTTENSWYWYQSKSLGATSPTLPTNNAATQLVTLTSAQVGTPLVMTGNLNVKTATSQSQLTTATTYDATATQTCTLTTSTMATGADVYYDFTVTAANTRYWFDTVGSSYDTVLYLVNKGTGNLMGCNDDAFSWLSAVTPSGVSSTVAGIAQKNSALVGVLQPGNYRLVLDKYDTSAFVTMPQNTGMYQLNMWPNIADPGLGGNPHGTAVTTPSYNQMITALGASGLGAMVTSIEMSGATCGQAVTSWERAFTRWSLEQLATDTGAVVGGTPVVYSVQQNGTPGPVKGTDPRCPTATNLGAVVSSAIANLTNNLTQPITAVANDYDDLTDFDGVKGVTAGNDVLTPTNIDDSTFVTSIVAQPVTGCSAPIANGYASCSPGVTPNFKITFAVPPTVTQSTVAQIFQFRIEIHGINGTIISTTPVTIVVPPVSTMYVPTDYYRDFNGATACPAMTQAVWTLYNWTSTTPGNSHIDYYVTAASTLAGLSTATEIPVMLAEAQASPNTQVGAVDVGAFLKAQSVPTNVNYLQLRMHVAPTSDGQQTPTLSSYQMSVDCQPSQ